MAGTLIIRTASGEIALDQDETLVRVVWQEKFDYLADTTRSIPEFDDTRGVFLLSYYQRKKQDGVGDYATLDRPDDWGWYQYLTMLETNPYIVPSLAWNNTTKILTIKPTNVSLNFASYPIGNYGAKSACLVQAVHYR